MDAHIDTLCLSSGGILGLSFIGVLKYLEEKKFINLKNITTYAGTSAGSVLSFLLNLDYSIKEIKQIFMHINFEKLESNIDICNIIENNGIDNGLKILAIIIPFLKEKYDVNDITFTKLYELTNKKIIIIGTNFTTLKEEIFSVDTTPSMSVIMAIRISISVPLLFTPILYNNNYYIDGAFTNAFPIKYCNKETTLGLYITYEYNTNIMNIYNLFLGCFAILSNTLSEKDINNYNVIKISNENLNIENYNINNKLKNNIIKLGKKTGYKYYNNIIYVVCLDIINNIITKI